MQEEKKVKLKRSAIICIILISILAMGTSVYAYLTTYAEAKGAIIFPKRMGKSILSEGTENLQKKIVVKVDKNEKGAYVRAKIYTSEYVTYSGDNWEYKDDGYYYYQKPLNPGESSSELLVTVKEPNEKNEFDVIVVQEATPIKYNASGEPYANWDTKYSIIE